LKVVIILLMLLFTAAQLASMGIDLDQQSKVRLAKRDLERFSRILEEFPYMPTVEQFWKVLGVEKRPRDPWGTQYILENPHPSIYLWRSAGRDLMPGNSDDLKKVVSLKEAIPEFDPNAPPQPLSKEAI